jgi:hypothetical protein
MRALAHDARVNGEERKPGKGVSFGQMGLLVRLARDQDLPRGNGKTELEEAEKRLDDLADFFQRVYEELDIRVAGNEQSQHLALSLIEEWQWGLWRPLPDQTDRRAFVPTPWEMRFHHQVLDRVLYCRRFVPGRLPDRYWIPCETCGRIVETRAPRFARTCQKCQHEGEYQQRLGFHKTGAGPAFTGGFYSRGAQRPLYVWPTVCEHPDCVEVFSAKNRTELYCAAHTRLSAYQARQRDSRPKHERFRFLCDEGTYIRHEFLIRGEQRVCLIGPDGYQARDIEEFRPLVERVKATGSLRIVRVS